MVLIPGPFPLYHGGGIRMSLLVRQKVIVSHFNNNCHSSLSVKLYCGVFQRRFLLRFCKTWPRLASELPQNCCAWVESLHTTRYVSSSKALVLFFLILHSFADKRLGWKILVLIFNIITSPWNFYCMGLLMLLTRNSKFFIALNIIILRVLTLNTKKKNGQITLNTKPHPDPQLYGFQEARLQKPVFFLIFINLVVSPKVNNQGDRKYIWECCLLKAMMLKRTWCPSFKLFPKYKLLRFKCKIIGLKISQT